VSWANILDACDPGLRTPGCCKWALLRARLSGICQVLFEEDDGDDAASTPWLRVDAPGLGTFRVVCRLPAIAYKEVGRELDSRTAS